MDVRYLLASVLGAAALMAGVAREATAQDATDPNLVARGSYLAKAADCMPCHTSVRDKPFAGGLRLNTPFGAIYSPNVTPDRETGIGAWTFEQFKGAVQAGIRADGMYLYALGSNSRTLSVYRIGKDRMLTELAEGKSPIMLTTGQSYLGLAVD